MIIIITPWGTLKGFTAKAFKSVSCLKQIWFILSSVGKKTLFYDSEPDFIKQTSWDRF